MLRQSGRGLQMTAMDMVKNAEMAENPALKPSVRKLRHMIEIREEELAALHDRLQDLMHPELLHLSQMLDSLIVQYEKERGGF